MDLPEHPQNLQDRLNLARAEEAEALRRAHHLRAIGSRTEYMSAMRDVDANHHEVARLQRQAGGRKME